MSEDTVSSLKSNGSRITAQSSKHATGIDESTFEKCLEVPG